MRAALTLLLGTLAFPAGGSPVTLDVTPGADFAPGAFRVRVTVEPHEGNRRLRVMAESLTYRESTTLQLEGDGAPRTHVVRFDGLPAGDYVIEARLERNDESTFRATRDVRVQAELPDSQHAVILPTGRHHP
jgi:hypothetical protein